MAYPGAGPLHGPGSEEDKERRRREEEAKAKGTTPEEQTAIANIAQGAGNTAQRAQEIAEAAGGRRTDPGQVTPSTAAGVTVRGTPNVETPNVEYAGPTTAPGVGPVGNIAAAQVAAPSRLASLGQNIAGGTDAAQASAAPTRVQGARDARGLQEAAGDFFQQQLAGNTPSVAQRDLNRNLAALAREQRSLAAGVRGQGAASALRNASTNIGLLGAGAVGQAADLRAKEISDAARGLLEAGTATRGQDVDVGKTEAQLGTQVELQNAALRDNAIQAARERYARGEITGAQLETEIAKSNAEFQQRTSEANQAKNLQVALANADQEFRAQLASDERLQNVFSERARLKLAAQQGDQQAATQLNGLQAQIDSEIQRFNAQQLQSASSQNIENRLKAIGLDDAFATAARDQWIRAELAGDAAGIELLKTQIEARIGQAMRDQASKDKWYDRITGLISTGAMAYAMASDERVKKDVRPVSGDDVDAYLRAMEERKTWEYKDPGRGEGRFAGPMAQTMEKGGPAAASAVVPMADGAKGLDYQQLAALAGMGLGRVNERLSKLEALSRG